MKIIGKEHVERESEKKKKRDYNKKIEGENNEKKMAKKHSDLKI